VAAPGNSFYVGLPAFDRLAGGHERSPPDGLPTDNRANSPPTGCFAFAGQPEPFQHWPIANNFDDRTRHLLAQVLLSHLTFLISVKPSGASTIQFATSYTKLANNVSFPGPLPIQSLELKHLLGVQLNTPFHSGGFRHLLLTPLSPLQPDKLMALACSPCPQTTPCSV